MSPTGSDPLDLVRYTLAGIPVLALAVAAGLVALLGPRVARGPLTALAVLALVALAAYWVGYPFW